jgi:hypothetical protein
MIPKISERGEGEGSPIFSVGAGGSNASHDDDAATPNFIFESGIHSVKTVNLKSDMPVVSDALQRLDRELKVARQEKAKLLKLIHGYGSTGEGGDIRIAVQKRLVEMTQSGQIRGCIFGENWSKSDEVVWSLLQSHSELKADSDLGRRNRGITIVVL